MKREANGYILLLSILLAVVIIAMIMFAKSGVYDKLMAPKQQQSAIKVQLNDVQDKVNNYNNKVEENLKQNSN